MAAELVLREGWAVKESGQVNLFGQTNWKRRWFRLVRSSEALTWSYYRKIEDITSDSPAGRVELDATYNARALEVGEKKKKPCCFALGPVFDDYAKRTYYISCDNEDDRLSWMECLTAAIEAGDQQSASSNFERDRKSIRRRITRRCKNKGNYQPQTAVPDSQPYLDPKWRLQQWENLGLVMENTVWKKCDTKNGITVSRGSFKHNDCIITKVEGVICVPPDITYDYIQQATQGGGKLDQLFRNEKVLQRIEDSIPNAEIVYNTYNVPLPSVSPRRVCLARVWVPFYISGGDSAGMLLWSSSHPLMPDSKDHTDVRLDLSGFVLSPTSDPDSRSLHTQVAVFVQIDLKDSLQSMVEGTYRSGLLKVGLRTAFTHISSQVEKYYGVIQA